MATRVAARLNEAATHTDDATFDEVETANPEANVED
jgi:hypothetical protein